MGLIPRNVYSFDVVCARLASIQLPTTVHPPPNTHTHAHYDLARTLTLQSGTGPYHLRTIVLHLLTISVSVLGFWFPACQNCFVYLPALPGDLIHRERFYTKFQDVIHSVFRNQVGVHRVWCWYNVVAVVNGLRRNQTAPITITQETRLNKAWVRRSDVHLF